MKNSNDHYDSPWKSAIERYFPEFIYTSYFKSIYSYFVANLSQNKKNLLGLIVCLIYVKAQFLVLRLPRLKAHF